MVIYYEVGAGVNITYDHNGQRKYDYFSSLHLFYVTIGEKYPQADLVRVNDSNYADLVKQGVL